MSDYDNWKTNDSDGASDYANEIMSNLSTKEVVKSAVEKGLCDQGGIYRMIESALFEYFVEDYYRDRR